MYQMSKMCDVCALPEELCVCDDVSTSETELEVHVEERKFNDMTIVEGFDSNTIDIDELSSELKSEFACGGTTKDNSIELQGNHYEELINTLENKGFFVL